MVIFNFLILDFGSDGSYVFWHVYHTLSRCQTPNFWQKTAKFLKTSENDGHEKSFHIYGRMVMASHQKPGFDDCLWPSFSLTLKMMVMGSHKKPVLDDYLWPSFSLFIRRMVIWCHQKWKVTGLPWPSFSYLLGGWSWDVIKRGRLLAFHDHHFPIY